MDAIFLNPNFPPFLTKINFSLTSISHPHRKEIRQKKCGKKSFWENFFSLSLSLSVSDDEDEFFFKKTSFWSWDKKRLFKKKIINDVCLIPVGEYLVLKCTKRTHEGWFFFLTKFKIGNFSCPKKPSSMFCRGSKTDVTTSSSRS